MNLGDLAGVDSPHEQPGQRGQNNDCYEWHRPARERPLAAMHADWAGGRRVERILLVGVHCILFPARHATSLS